MLQDSEYVITWAAYYAGALGVLLVWWRMTRPIPWRPLRQLLRVVLAGLLLVPAPVAPDMQELAPAILVLLFDITLLKEGDTLRALVYLVYGLLLGLLALVADGLVQYLLARRRPPTSAAP
jgi:hypothetical protein